MGRMNSTDPLHDHAAELIDAARAFHAAASEPGRHTGAPLSLARTEEALQLLSRSWYQIAADAAPGIAQRGRREALDHPDSRGKGLSHEQEVHLIATFHDVAAAFARCARVCREARPVVSRRMDRAEVEPERDVQTSAERAAA
jgi:hypothetical protein